MSASERGSISRNGEPVSPSTSLVHALRDAVSGDVLVLGAGRHGTGPFPIEVPAGVTVRAADGAATHSVVIDAGGSAGLVLASGATIEGVTVTGSMTAPSFDAPGECVTARDADHVTVRHCLLDGVTVHGGTGHRIEGNVIASGSITVERADAVLVAANFQHGRRWGAGIDVIGGHDVIVEHNECHDDFCAIRVARTDGARVEYNRVEARWFGVQVRDAAAVVVRRNRVRRATRAVAIDGGRNHLVQKNTVEGCDTGVQIERLATGVQLEQNWLHGCRVGILAWGARGTVLHGNAISEAREHAVVADQPIDLTAEDLGGAAVRIAAPSG